ncbi:4-deoxy-L-threo-5-hexosulose-uronate ketol-isomerase [Lentzea sp. NBRC 105346]|uniref:5-dehydro-4-deoxy-D-glucuronate isomerase n=1 Tax=Lentzea sp. NBRC 105346 TaxID=3032205 RepID=UPI00249FFE5E|nr:5-dehydro-4-deoxy-D-glucuronate isomerase [Lentzea sp. NBRC 105346]GLZ32950.1 4-deoxy-L-threo-5-hexosulose-uronate ketol-isomerase [Lentzea sp. NBRC 105346]
MQIRHSTHPAQLQEFDTDQLRAHYLVEDLFVAGEIKTVYTHEDRIVVGGAAPVPGRPLTLDTYDPLRTSYFCERRELAALVVRGSGSVSVDGTEHKLGTRDCVYIGQGSRDVQFHATEDDTHFYLFSTPSHASFPTAVARFDEVDVLHMGSPETANVREIRKFIHADGIRSSQLVLGVTRLASGSVWNTMPPHTHDRRTECYLYFDLPEDQRVIHLCGEPQRTRNMVVRNEELVISPAWSIHSGVGTSAYTFVWAMGGENQAYDDMDQVAVTELR